MATPKKNYNVAAPTLINPKHTEGNYYQLPQDIMDIVYNELSNSSAQIRIMSVLIGTKDGFKVSEQWILDRTGLKHGSYVRAKQELCARGWLTHTEGKEIRVNYDAIKPAATPGPQADFTLENCHMVRPPDDIGLEICHMVGPTNGNESENLSYGMTNLDNEICHMVRPTHGGEDKKCHTIGPTNGHEDEICHMIGPTHGVKAGNLSYDITDF